MRSPDPVRSRETPFANYIVDAIREEAGADVGLQNGGGIRSDMVYGANEDIILRDIISILPFPNTVVSVEVTGEIIVEALENGLSAVEDGDGRFPHVSGMSYVWDPDAAVGDRVVSVEVDGEPLDANATYSLATNDFMLGGGDGYDMLAEGTVLISPDEGTLLSLVVADQIREDETVDVTTDGRIQRAGD